MILVLLHGDLSGHISYHSTGYLNDLINKGVCCSSSSLLNWFGCKKTALIFMSRRDAADYAISISKKYNAKLYILHVIRADLAAETSESFMTRMEKEAEEYLNKVKVNADEVIL
jgi:hypothetical protein